MRVVLLLSAAMALAGCAAEPETAPTPTPSPAITSHDAGLGPRCTSGRRRAP